MESKDLLILGVIYGAILFGGFDEGTSVVPTPSVEARCKPLNQNQVRMNTK